MTEIWETVDNALHRNIDDPNIVMKKKDICMSWIQLPSELGGARAPVLKKSLSICRCKKHETSVYVLEKDIVCYYCRTIKGFEFAYK